MITINVTGIALAISRTARYDGWYNNLNNPTWGTIGEPELPWITFIECVQNSIFWNFQSSNGVIELTLEL